VGRERGGIKVVDRLETQKARDCGTPATPLLGRPHRPGVVSDRGRAARVAESRYPQPWMRENAGCGTPATPLA